MSTIDDLVAQANCLRSPAVAEDLATLDAAEWERLDALRTELRRFERADELVFALALSDEQWAAICKLRDALHSVEGRRNDEFRRMILCTLESMSDPTPPEDMASIDDPLPSDDPEVDRRIEEDRRRFHRRYFELKARAGLSTIQEVARKAGISPTTVQAIESHAVRPQFRTVRKLADAFGVPVTELWG